MLSSPKPNPEPSFGFSFRYSAGAYRRCRFAVYTTSKPYRFENAPLLKAYSKRPGSDNELDRNEMRNRIETDAVTNETASVNSALFAL